MLIKVFEKRNVFSIRIRSFIRDTFIYSIPDMRERERKKIDTCPHLRHYIKFLKNNGNILIINMS